MWERETDNEEGRSEENKQIERRMKEISAPWEQSSPIQPGKHWQEPSIGLQVPLLVQRQISAQALPYLPLGHTANGRKPPPKTTQNINTNMICASLLTGEDQYNPLTSWHSTWTHSEPNYANKVIVWKAE